MTNYRKGYEFEREIVKLHKKWNYPLVIRAGGSFGPIDIAAFSKDEIKLIQAKSGRLNLSPKKKLILLALKHLLPDCCTIEIWVRQPKRKAKIFKLDSEFSAQSLAKEIDL